MMSRVLVALCPFLVAVVLVPAVPAIAGTDEALAAVRGQVQASAKLSDSLKSFVNEKLMPLATNATIVKAVEEQNAQKKSLDEIKAIDAEWSKAESELAIHKEKMTNACAQELKKFAAQFPAIGEVFVMDNQGANVGQNTLTSDYWQGDESKWQGSFNGGKGGVDVADKKLDKSTDTVDQKVSFPIIDASGAVIGAVCFGINPDKI